jgi:ribonuclease P protein component
MADPSRFPFPRTHRLGGKTSFAAVYDARVRQSQGPLTIYAHANGLKHSRLGLSVSRRVGTAPRRNRIKRMLRESFRLLQHDLPAGYDWVVVVRAHEPLELAEYQNLLRQLTSKLHAACTRRAAKPPG